jgi:hypothetical protein
MMLCRAGLEEAPPRDRGKLYIEALVSVASAEWMPCVQLDAAVGCGREIGLCLVTTQHCIYTGVCMEEVCFHPLRTLVDMLGVGALSGSCAKHMESGRIGRTLMSVTALRRGDEGQCSASVVGLSLVDGSLGLWVVSLEFLFLPRLVGRLADCTLWS